MMSNYVQTLSVIVQESLGRARQSCTVGFLTLAKPALRYLTIDSAEMTINERKKLFILYFSKYATLDFNYVKKILKFNFKVLENRFEIKK